MTESNSEKVEQREGTCRRKMLEQERIRVKKYDSKGEREEKCRHYVNEIVSVCEIN